jgi:hypothetical protein
MPVSEYYGGHGRKVMREMKERYGSKRGERVFYATANKRGLTPEQKRSTKGSAPFSPEELSLGYRRVRG